MLNPIVDDYNIRDKDFYRRVKHISAYYDLQKTWHERFAWKPIRSDKSGKFIWLTKYWALEVRVIKTYSDYPEFDKVWEMRYTREEHILEKLGVT